MKPSLPPDTTTPPVPILMVDDNPTKRLALKAVLAPLGYSIVEADSGVAALRCVLAQDFAVILLDVLMPIMDGFETAALIRQRQQSEMTPIIFITAHGKDELEYTNLYAEGAADFIFAPIAPDELRAKVSFFANIFVKAAELATRAREVRRSADQLRLLTDAAPIGIFQTDSENRYVYTNPRWSEITGVPPEEAAGRRWDTIVGEQERAGLTAELPDDGLHREELCHRFAMRLPGSATRIVLVTSRAIPAGEGGMAGWVGTLADVTAETGAEAAMSDARDKATEASRLKSDFLANMSHEIRTPMNGVIGMTDLLLETELDARQSDYAQTVRNSGEALLTIINNILDFSKIEAGKLDIEDVGFEVRAIVDDVVDLLAGPAQSKGLELVAVVESSVPAVVSGDPGRVRQVLTNLIGNAIKFTQSGEIAVRVIAHGIVAGDSVLRFEVSDTGDGIAPDKLAMVFQPFVQADSSNSRRYGGTGLGLAISSHLVSLMGGEVGVSSRLGTGSDFWFTVHVRAESERSGSDASPDDAGLAGIGALIVDDSARQRRALSEYLIEWGMGVDAVDSGRAALETMRTAATQGRPFAVALIDRSMPGMDGLELIDAIVADPALSARFVLMTDLGQEGEVGDLYESGVRVSLSKPVHREDLRTCLRVALGLQVLDEVPAELATASPLSATQRVAGRLLLAEDNLINQKVAVAMLSGSGYQVDTVLNGASAVQAAGAEPYDAILMDCQMPELSGYEATSAIRAQEGSARHTPIIGMTAGARREDRERCLAAGMDGYLAKPVSKDALVALVNRFVKNARHAPRPSLDMQVVRRVGRLGEGLMGELAALFLVDADVRIVSLREALAADDAAAIVESAHILRGAAAIIGATGLGQLCSTLEEAGADGKLVGDGAPLLEAVEAELERVRSALVPLVPAA